MTSAETLLASWYFQAPNFALAALMYTFLGRVLLSFFVVPESRNYIWRFFCRLTDPALSVMSFVTPKAVNPIVMWLFGFVWLFWLRVLLMWVFLAYVARQAG